jgi:hypothetical protein
MKIDSPEDRLLNLIKGKHKQKTERDKSSPQAEKPLPEKAVKSKLPGIDIGNPSFLNPVNKVLLVILVLLSIYFVSTFLYTPYESLDTITERGNTSRSYSVPPVKPEEMIVEDYSVYGDKISARGPFKSLSTRGEAGKKFVLVGIIDGDKPQAAIKDTTSQGTIYLYEGQTSNGVTVKEIGDRRVILIQNGTEIELTL